MKTTKVSVYDLTYLYFKNFYQAIPTEAQIQWIQYQFQQALNRGFVSEELLEAMKNAKEKRDTRIFTLDQYLKQLARHRKNLVEDGVFYYHNELRITSLPPVVHYDIDSGELIRKVQPYFLEMVASYDIENLINYYKTKIHLYDAQTMNDSRLKGALEWLIKQYDLESVLFMIDAAEQAIAGETAKPLKNPSNLHEFFREGKKMKELKETECKRGGGATIEPKQRLYDC
ncbi:MAG: hypothetical protein IIZ99_01920 [Turicibacter sp.]|nr:hypothetical protein [Turicibacter sp.]